MRVLLFALACVALPARADAPAPVPKPFHAEYLTLRNGSEVGRTTLDLRDNGDGSWTLRSHTRGTSGLARLAGIDVTDTSRLRWRDGRPEALAYDYRQDSALKQRTRHAEFDWNHGQVQVSEGGEDHRYATVPGLIDRQCVTLALAADLLRGASHFDYAVAVKDRVEAMRYERGPLETLHLPAGDYEAQLMRRAGEPGADRKRVARSWFAPALGYLPVQIEQTQKKGDTITLQLLRLD